MSQSGIEADAGTVVELATRRDLADVHDGWGLAVGRGHGVTSRVFNECHYFGFMLALAARREARRKAARPIA